ncbi:hypothetical protein [Hymenobacter negativus]|uniref:Uncharacterized protein n=1 Tax=Hymenobacter negativus TaxID=2795026 RepID=A0ABS3Q8L0_9BACT|nr:hypothetical protein [Hymenobacter negativus]MBO2007574.1 hypothetical protein [Hymenobacter negativus]
MNKIVKWVLISVGIIGGTLAGLYFLFLLALGHAMGAFDRTYTKADLIEHYEAKAPELRALSTYVNARVPAHASVEIEFDGTRTIPIFHVKARGVHSNNWDVAWDSPKADTLLQQLGWTRQTLTSLQARLDRAGCISVSSGEPCNIGYQRSGMGKFSYNLFARPMSDSVKEQYNRGCVYCFYKPGVVFEYGGGAVGPQCFPSEPVGSSRP